MKITIEMGIVYMIGAIGDTLHLLIMLIQSMSQFYDGRGQNRYRHYKGNKNEQSFLEVVHHRYKSNQGILSYGVKKNINYGRKVPNPIRFSIFFSKFQKN